jgi:hypothetical protein
MYYVVQGYSPSERQESVRTTFLFSMTNDDIDQGGECWLNTGHPYQNNTFATSSLYRVEELPDLQRN